MGDVYRFEWRKGKREGYALWDVSAKRVDVFTKTGNSVFPGTFDTQEGWSVSQVVERMYVTDLYIITNVWKQLPQPQWVIEIAV